MESTGCKELDIALGGLDWDKIILIKGPPGAGKIVLGYAFLKEGIMKNQRCFYMFHKKNIQEAEAEVRQFGMNNQQLIFINTNSIYESEPRKNVIILDINNISTIENIDEVFESNLPIRGVITVLSHIFRGKNISTAFYMMAHVRHLLSRHEKDLVIFTMEKGTVKDEDVEDVEEMVDIVIEMIPQNATDGNIIIKKSYKPIAHNKLAYRISPNNISLKIMDEN